jgi:NAD(P)-dependent dehydrogenase (short-subunit alcohol dehydrogenase family)
VAAERHELHPRYPVRSARDARAQVRPHRQRQLDGWKAALDRHAELLGHEGRRALALADLYAKDGILCNAVTPGPTLSPAWLAEGGLADQVADRTGKTREQVLADVGKARPIGRMAEPAEIAAAIVFLCSDRASFVTGAAWSVDGGTVPVII